MQDLQSSPRARGQVAIVDDLVMIDDVSEQSILLTLQKRYETERIYTFIGPVLVSLNPYKQLNIYSAKQIADYRGRYPYELPPHIYAIAEDAYRSLVSEGEDQSIIISGESGAGKTENSKKIMEYISAVCGTGSERADYVKSIFLESNPLLEAFGNAKTVRNDNSSRFGKYMEMQFNYNGQPVGGRIRNYLLEKSRVLKQTADERNFHIFYQILAGLSEQEKTSLGLAGSAAPDFKYLSKGGCYTVKGLNDAESFSQTRVAMKTIGMTPEDQTRLFAIVSSILNLSNVELGKKSDGNGKIQDDSKSLVGMIAALLGVPAEVLEQALTHRTVTTTRGRGSLYKVPLTPEQCSYTIDAFAKGLYERLFQWIVRRINKEIEMLSEGFIIGVLDIYGFEIFASNSLEQLCINYCNEKLQQVFIELTLKSEQEEYSREGIPWENVDYFNNEKCVELIEKKPTGIFALLDEECVIQYGEDSNFVNKVSTRLKDNPHLVVQSEKDKLKSSKTAGGFTIKHYAGVVTYDSDGFIDKNKDTFSRDLKEVLTISKFDIVQQLVPEGLGDNTTDKKRPLNAATHFQNEVAALMKALYACRPHYIRCIKPNPHKQPIHYDVQLVTDQVRYLGLLENVRVRRAGYAYRQTFEKFLARYKMLTKETWTKFRGTPIEGCKLILNCIQAPSATSGQAPFQFGKTKIFVRNPDWIWTLEELRQRKIWDIVKKIQSCWRAYAQRKYYLQLRAESLGIFEGKKERKRRSVNQKFYGDYLMLTDQPKIKPILRKFGDHKILFSAMVNKINTSLKPQQRCMMITDKAIYLLDPKKFTLKRRLDMTAITSLSLSTLSDGYFVVHVAEEKNNYDYVGNSDKRTEIVTVLLTAVKKVTSRDVQLNFSDKIEFRARKGKKELVFQKGPKDGAQKKGSTLQVQVDSSDLATAADFAGVIEWMNLKKSASQPKTLPVIVRRGSTIADRVAAFNSANQLK